MDELFTARSQKTARKLLNRVKRTRTLFYLTQYAQSALLVILTIFALIAFALFIELKFHPPRIISIIVTAIEFAALIWITKKFILKDIKEKVSDTRMSIILEDRIPKLEDRLISAVEFHKEAEHYMQSNEFTGKCFYLFTFSKELLNAFYEDCRTRIKKIKFRKVIFRRKFIITTALFIISCGIIMNIEAFLPYTPTDLINMLINPFMHNPFSRPPVMVVMPGDIKILPGEDVLITAHMITDTQKIPRIHFTTIVEDSDDRWEEDSMDLKESEIHYVPGGGEEVTSPDESRKNDFEYNYKKVIFPLKYYVTLGPDRSREYKIEIVAKPHLRSIRVKQNYPDYMKKPPLTGPEGEGDIETFFGTNLEIFTSFDMDIEKGTLIVEEENPGRRKGKTKEYVMSRRDSELVARFIADTSGFYKINVQGDENIKKTETKQYKLKVKPDLAPEITLLNPRTDIYGKENPQIMLEYSAKDDVGIEKVDLVFEIGKITYRKNIHEFTYGSIDEQGSYKWSIFDLTRETPVKYHLEAFDWCPEEMAKLKPEERRKGRTAERMIYWEKISGEMSDEGKLKVNVNNYDSGENISEAEQYSYQSGQPTEEVIFKLDSEITAKIVELQEKQADLNEKMEELAEKSKLSEEDKKRLEQLKQEQLKIAEESIKAQKELNKKLEKFKDEIKDATKKSSAGSKQQGDKPGSGNNQTQMQYLSDKVNKLGLQKENISANKISVEEGIAQKMRKAREMMSKGQLKGALRQGQELERELMSMSGRSSSSNSSGTGMGGSSNSDDEQGAGGNKHDENEKRGNIPKGFQQNEQYIYDLKTRQQDGITKSRISDREYSKDTDKTGRRFKPIREITQSEAFMNEKYPTKYRGLVESYLQTLAEMEPEPEKEARNPYEYNGVNYQGAHRIY